MDELESRWNAIPWETVCRARGLGLACRLDRYLEEVAAVAPRAEAALAGRLRSELRDAVAGLAAPDELLAAVGAVHRELAYLPRAPLPAGVYGLLRDVLGQARDRDVVVAGVPEPVWPKAHQRPRRPVAVMPLAEGRNPLMWPLVALQAAALAGVHQPESYVEGAVGGGLWLALAEAALGSGTEARELWERGRGLLAPGDGEPDRPWQLARALAEGVLISGHRRGARNSGGEGIYSRLGQVQDDPAHPGEILGAGWIHWYARVAPELVELAEISGADGAWRRMRSLVDRVDDLLCRSLDVAAIHRFFAAGGSVE
ncbi:MAG: hypothetical protein H0Z37_04080 [Firmicutes bacterium]|nr:hypothetical protein [Bacillota bacterium]